MEAGIPHLLAAALRPASTRLTSTNSPNDRKEDHPGAVGAWPRVCCSNRICCGLRSDMSTHCESWHHT